MSEKLPFDGIVGGLLQYAEDRLIGLNSGDLPEWATVEQWARLLSAKGTNRSTAAEGKVKKWLQSQSANDRAPWRDSGHTQRDPYSRLKALTRPDRHKGSEGIPECVPVYLIKTADMVKLVPIIKQVGYMSQNVTVILGSGTVRKQQTQASTATALPRPNLATQGTTPVNGRSDYDGPDELPTRLLKRELYGAGCIRNRLGDSIGFDDFVSRTPDFKAFAQKPRLSGKKGHGSEAIWFYSKVVEWLTEKRYSIEYLIRNVPQHAS